jgi:hypothetical protein
LTGSNENYGSETQAIKRNLHVMAMVVALESEMV